MQWLENIVGTLPRDPERYQSILFLLSCFIVFSCILYFLKFFAEIIINVFKKGD